MPPTGGQNRETDTPRLPRPSSPRTLCRHPCGRPCRRSGTRAGGRARKRHPDRRGRSTERPGGLSSVRRTRGRTLGADRDHSDGGWRRQLRPVLRGPAAVRAGGRPPYHRPSHLRPRSRRYRRVRRPAARSARCLVHRGTPVAAGRLLSGHEDARRALGGSRAWRRHRRVLGRGVHPGILSGPGRHAHQHDHDGGPRGGTRLPEGRGHRPAPASAESAVRPDRGDPGEAGAAWHRDRREYGDRGAWAIASRSSGRATRSSTMPTRRSTAGGCSTFWRRETSTTWRRGRPTVRPGTKRGCSGSPGRPGLRRGRRHREGGRATESDRVARDPRGRAHIRFQAC